MHFARLELRVGLMALTVGASAVAAQQVDSATRAERVATRMILLDSLAKGRQLWKRAAVDAYVIQSRVECDCPFAPDARLPPALLTIRNGRVVSRAPAIGEFGSVEEWWTVDSLFDYIERDLRGGTEADVASIVGRPSVAEDFVRKATRLDLHPLYGFPLRYRAETPEMPDVWTDIRVDTFAVLPRSASQRHPRTHP